jgi:hypothetical protein
MKSVNDWRLHLFYGRISRAMLVAIFFTLSFIYNTMDIANFFFRNDVGQSCCTKNDPGHVVCLPAVKKATVRRDATVRYIVMLI